MVPLHGPARGWGLTLHGHPDGRPTGGRRLLDHRWVPEGIVGNVRVIVIEHGHLRIGVHRHPIAMNLGLFLGDTPDVDHGVGMVVVRVILRGCDRGEEGVVVDIDGRAGDVGSITPA